MEMADRIAWEQARSASGPRRPPALRAAAGDEPIVREGPGAVVQVPKAPARGVRDEAPGTLPPLQSRPMKLLVGPDGRLELTEPSGTRPLVTGRARKSVPAPGRPAKAMAPGKTARVGTPVAARRGVRSRTAAASTREQHFRVQQLRLMLGLKVAALSVILILTLALALNRPAAAGPVATVHQIPPPSPDAYVRIPVPADHVPGIVWMIRLDDTALAVVDDTWKDMDQGARVEQLQQLVALSGEPKELLLLSARSELWAEVYEKAYRFYR